MSADADCRYLIKKKLVLRIRDVYPGSDFLYPGSDFLYPESRVKKKGDTECLCRVRIFSSRIQGAENTGSRIPIRKTVKELGFVISNLID
jgi:hypothetical protein